MQDKIKNIIVTFGFSIILITIFIINLIQADKIVSSTERRKLAQLPKFNAKSIINGETAKKFDSYALDQFVARDLFRSIKSFVSVNIFKQKDNNNLFETNNSIYKMEYPLNKIALEKSLDKLNNIYNNYLNGMNVYYAIIPDKNHYLKNDDHLKIDYGEIVEISKSNLKKMNYIDIENSLSLDDYYRTDLHWKQENLKKVVKTIENNMKLEDTSKITYNKEDKGDFFGVYYGQLGANVQPDRLYTLSSETIENAITYNYETNKNGKVYVTPKTSDKYDTYLEGATSLISIENPNAKTKKELLLFRDSFGSSIAPLLIENYSKITLIDLRYMSQALLSEYIDFNNQDVLFLYSTSVLTQNIFK